MALYQQDTAHLISQVIYDHMEQARPLWKQSELFELHLIIQITL